MGIVRSIYGPEVSVGEDPMPAVTKRIPKGAKLVCIVYRGTNVFGDPLVDGYYLCQAKTKSCWALWCNAPEFYNDRILRLHQPLTWCDHQINPKVAATAMLRFIWETDQLRLEGSIETGLPVLGGLLKLSEVNEIKKRVLGYNVDDVDFDLNGGKPKGPRFRMAGPNDPIYREGWVIGNSRSQTSEQAKNKKTRRRTLTRSQKWDLNDLLSQVAKVTGAPATDKDRKTIRKEFIKEFAETQ